MAACSFGEWTDFGNGVYHSDCCQTIYVDSHEDEIGHFSRIYVEQQPYVHYKKVNSEKYIYYRVDLNQWVFADSYQQYSFDPTLNPHTDWRVTTDYTDWRDLMAETVSFKSDETESCPDKMTLWFSPSDPANPGVIKSTDVAITCDTGLGNRCPDTHPFAYNDGTDCCENPFEDFNDVLGRTCDGSPISLESKCCLNAYKCG